MGQSPEGGVFSLVERGVPGGGLGFFTRSGVSGGLGECGYSAAHFQGRCFATPNEYAQRLNEWLTRMS